MQDAGEAANQGQGEVQGLQRKLDLLPTEWLRGDLDLGQRRASGILIEQVTSSPATGTGWNAGQLCDLASLRRQVR
jgi:hypothetical protein